MKKLFFNYMKVRSLFTFLLLVHFLSISTFVEAKVKLPSVLSSNMVLQQHKTGAYTFDEQMVLNEKVQDFFKK